MQIKQSKPIHVSIPKFIRDLSVESGTVRVPNSVIYYEYRFMWHGHSRNSKLNRIEFFRQFSKQFKQFRSGSIRGYLLNNSFNLSKDNMFKAATYDR